MRRTLIAGNWKMNGSKASVTELVNGICAGLDEVNNADMAVCPPFIYLPMVAELIAEAPLAVGAQNICDQEAGAYTGEISSAMLKDFGCQYALMGHSERRTLYAEDDALIAKRFFAAKAAGITPILCVGETLEQRESGVTESVVAEQIDAVLNVGGIEALDGAVLAYEPVWAIGTGKTASPDQAQEVHAFIRQKLAALNADIAAKVQVLYGGSMNAGNAAELLSQPDIDGGLIGGASLKPADFLSIGKAAA